jgi:Kef-type K+ transport system membrane component KefB/mannitol/fructose-specific phosphotransferase system IIA component (Ntr-type)
MERLTSPEVTMMFLALGTLLATARFLGEMARRFHQPAVVGEILAGILLGPTVLGVLTPEWQSMLFPGHGRGALVFEGLTTLAIALFLLVAGMEVELSTMWRQGRIASTVAVAGMVGPFGLGFVAAWVGPQFFGWEQDTSALIFALFFATALSISALPVIARTLMDINLYRSDLGMVVIAAAICNDLAGWIIFAVILGLMGNQVIHGLGIGHTIWLTLSFALITLTVGRWVIHRVLPWIKAHTSWPGGILGFALSLALFGAAITEHIGVHAIFGAFLVGVAIGDSSHLREQTRAVINQFVSCIFAPLFFASIGLKVNFAAHFDGALLCAVLLIACLGKVVGCGLGARYSGMPPREAWAVGFAMNARGAMEIILGLLALQQGLIGERLFVALVIMALVTSMLSGPMMQRLLGRRKSRQITDYLTARAFLHPLHAHNRQEAIAALSRVMRPTPGLSADSITAAVMERECIMPTGLSHGVALPHARLAGVSAPVVAVGLSSAGIDFDAADGQLAQIIFLLLTPLHDDGAQLEILADITRIFRHAEVRERALEVGNYTEFLALLKSESADVS